MDKQTTVHPITRQWAQLSCKQTSILLLIANKRLFVPNWKIIENSGDEFLEAAFPHWEVSWLWGPDHFDALFGFPKPRVMAYIKALYRSWPTPIVGGVALECWVNNIKRIYDVHKLDIGVLDAYDLLQEYHKLQAERRDRLKKMAMELIAAHKKNVARKARERRRSK